MPVKEIRERIVDFPQERISERARKQGVDVPVPHVKNRCWNGGLDRLQERVSQRTGERSIGVSVQIAENPLAEETWICPRSAFFQSAQESRSSAKM